jgi:nicotinic acid mononucleotide adenylyltransferase
MILLGHHTLGPLVLQDSKSAIKQHTPQDTLVGVYSLVQAQPPLGLFCQNLPKSAAKPEDPTQRPHVISSSRHLVDPSSRESRSLDHHFHSPTTHLRIFPTPHPSNARHQSQSSALRISFSFLLSSQQHHCDTVYTFNTTATLYNPHARLSSSSPTTPPRHYLLGAKPLRRLGLFRRPTTGHFCTLAQRLQYHSLSNLVAMSAAPSGTMTMNDYTFPTERLRSQLRDASRTPLVLVACGSFSPITFLHLRMFEMAADYARFNTNFEVVGAYISAVGDAYKKSGLVKAEHRINMCSLAVEQSSWISGMFFFLFFFLCHVLLSSPFLTLYLIVDPWEALHEDYLETAKVLDHFEHEINTTRGPFNTLQGPKKARIALLAGADLIQTMSAPGVWAPNDIDYILSNFGAFIIEVCLAAIHCQYMHSNTQQYREVVPTLTKHCRRCKSGKTTSTSCSSWCRTIFLAQRSVYSASAI